MSAFSDDPQLPTPTEQDRYTLDLHNRLYELLGKLTRDVYSLQYSRDNTTGGSLQSTVLTGSGTYTPTFTGYIWVTLTAVGGTGGVGAAGQAAGGGGAGETLWRVQVAVTSGVGISYAIGTAGVATTFGSLSVAPGGNGATGAAGGAGGVGGGTGAAAAAAAGATAARASSSTYQIPGGGGGGGGGGSGASCDKNAGGTSAATAGGGGAASPWGPGANGNAAAAGSNAASTSYGAGGSGGGRAGASPAGGTGGPGTIRIEYVG